MVLIKIVCIQLYEEQRSLVMLGITINATLLNTLESLLIDLSLSFSVQKNLLWITIWQHILNSYVRTTMEKWQKRFKLKYYA